MKFTSDLSVDLRKNLKKNILLNLEKPDFFKA